MESPNSSRLLEETKILKREDPEISWQEIGRKLGEHPEKIRSIWRRNFNEEIAPVEKEDVFPNGDISNVICEDKKISEDIDWRELIDYAEIGQDINDRSTIYQKIGTVEIDTDKPVAVVYTGDWHLGSTTIDYEQWTHDIQYIMDTDGLYMIGLGDDNENMRSFRTLSAVLSQVLSPPQQMKLMFSIVEELCEKNKLLAKVTGNHDVEFDERIFGQSLMAMLYRNLRTPVFSNRGVLHIKVKDQIYTNLIFHKSRFRSFLRPVHGAFREWQMSYPAEVVVGAHDHTPGAEIMNGYTLAQQDGQNVGGEVFLVKVGSYNDSEYGWRYFHNGGIFNPTIVYYPDRHKKLLFTSPEDAMQFIEGG